jgi:hypothetical protein
MDELENKINAFNFAAAETKTEISKISGLALEAFDIQMALCEVLRLDQWELLDRRLTSGQMTEHLRFFKFLAKIELEESILPTGIAHLRNEEKFKIKGEIWQIHKNDVDPFPSSPHAHNYASRIVLHLGTGEMFSTQNRTSLGTLGCKKLMLLRQKLANFSLPETHCF